MTGPGLPLAFGVERVVDDEFAFEDFVVVQAESAEAESHPAQAFAGGVRVRRMGVRGPHDFAQQLEGRFREVIFFQDGVE